MNQSSFGLLRDRRELLIRNLATSVILYESVTTTEAKARAVQPVIERLISIAQSKDALTARRTLLGVLQDKNAVTKILEELVPRFGDRTSGFTRRLRLPARLGDGAPQTLIQLSQTVLLDPKATTHDEKPAKKTGAKKEEAAAPAEESTEDEKTN